MFRQVRKIHTIPTLSYDTANGIPGLFSPSALRVAWTDHQTDIVSRLSEAVVDTDNEARIPFHILLNTARRADRAHVFNYASQAHNNHLFFESLTSHETAAKASPSPALLRRIEERFGSVENLKQAFKEATATVHGNGWIFLIEQPDKKLDIVSSHNAGTPYHFGRQQSLDLAGPVSEDDLAHLQKLQHKINAKEKNFNIALLALNLWQHAYILDFGIAGREDYIEAWWRALDWNKINARLYN
ncbi:37S ribosomal protein S26, mitochondrial [Wickerhamiella sorbophila]|uniref:37S ribosomal protein S26, mitochondrial n=1 Tax=Wickerhamiella sorbophila TaxID=45607 RepID=A0A2T0FEN9_9ASCO|nr:37S ribosomal protein S26, mitochondrial [Wickerhamiella sorbophila]PRT53466.1 37S ribosomal protein S26, mitochondrial [Wickerhamiella sorbophila]